MKKVMTKVAFGLLIVSMSSCATVFGGKVSDFQRTTPAQGELQRKVRTGALIADIVLFFPAAIVDFATGAIYKPEGK
jgi:hypothetical protein